MSDEGLRALLRGAESGDAEARIRAARALERAGRGDDAVRVLLRGGAEARTELARWPCWDGEPGADAHPGPLERPREKWRVSLPVDSTTPSIVASASAVIRASLQGTVVLDPEDGRVRHSLGRAITASLRGSRVVLGEGTYHRVYDLESGALLDERKIATRLSSRYHASFDATGARVVMVSENLVELRALDPAPREVWRRELDGRYVAVEGERVLVWGAEKTMALDLETGRTLWEVPGFLVRVDAAGFLLREPQGYGDVVMRTRDGELGWRLKRRWPHEQVLGRDRVVFGTIDSPSFIEVLDRASGAVVHRQEVEGLGRLAVVGEAILHWPRRGVLGAMGMDGRKLWETEATGLQGNGEMAITAGRLFVGSAEEVVCFEDGCSLVA